MTWSRRPPAKSRTHAMHGTPRGLHVRCIRIVRVVLLEASPSTEKAYRGEFEEVPNRKHVWRKTIDLNGEEFVVYAVQTQP
jgi:hypothetical protein